MRDRPQSWRQRNSWLIAFVFSGPAILAIGAVFRTHFDAAKSSLEWIAFIGIAYPLTVLALWIPSRALARRSTDSRDSELTGPEIVRMFRVANGVMVAFLCLALCSLLAQVPETMVKVAIVFGGLSALFVIISSTWHFCFIARDRGNICRVVFAIACFAFFATLFTNRLTRVASEPSHAAEWR